MTEFLISFVVIALVMAVMWLGSRRSGRGLSGCSGSAACAEWRSGECAGRSSDRAREEAQR